MTQIFMLPLPCETNTLTSNINSITHLGADQKKIPQPNHVVMCMLVESLLDIDTDMPVCYEGLQLTSALDSSEDYLASENIMRLIEKEIKKFRAQLMQESGTKLLKDLTKLISPPKDMPRTRQPRLDPSYQVMEI